MDSPSQLTLSFLTLSRFEGERGDLHRLEYNLNCSATFALWLAQNDRFVGHSHAP